MPCPCAGVLVVGTNGELNLSKPLLNVFQSAMHLRCDMHMKDNIKSKLSSLGVPPLWEKNTWRTFLAGKERLDLSTARMELNLIVVFKKIKTVWETRHAKVSDFYGLLSLLGKEQIIFHKGN